MPAFTSLAILVSLLFTASIRGHVTSGRERYGVIGYGVVMYDPPCAYACIDTVKGWDLDCGGDHDDMDSMDMGSMAMSSTTPECRATNDPFLQTLAWCFHTHCLEVKNSTLETIWEMDVVARLAVQPMPAYSYQVALSRVAQAPPTYVLDSKAVLNTTSLVDEESWVANFNGDQGFETMEIRTETYAIILFVTCVGIPIVVSWFRFLPLNQGVVSKVYATFIDPPLFGQYHAVPVLGMGFVPTRGQGLFIAYIWTINIILSSVGYEVRDPMSWYASLEQQLINYISNRTGTLSFVNLAIAILFSSRNNVLLFVTNWSHATFLLMHRWIAVICMLQACLHSAIYLQFYLDPLTGDGAYAEESKQDYWIWGIIATLALVLLMPLSLLPLRRRFYEFFLASHVVLAVLAMIGCLLHIYYRYEWQWGYQTWVWLSFAFWLFDRFLARPLRLARNGVKRAFVTAIDDDYWQIEVPGVEGDGHAYLYFPTLTWRFWENHPFSVAAVSSGGIHAPGSPTNRSLEHGSGTPTDEGEKSMSFAATATQLPNQCTGPGLVLFIRREHGLTSHLIKHADTHAGIPVLVESSYGLHMSIVESPAPRPSLSYPNIVCIAGGVGITGVLPYLFNGPGGLGKTKLFWGVRTEPLVRAVRGIVGKTIRHDDSGMETWAGADVTVAVGKRFDIDAILREATQNAEGGSTVIVCGPAGMADGVRLAVARLGKTGVVIRLVEESFSW
ncbi:ferric reductase like transmembrane component-domain-containing protein [Coniochaeta sp. 2T2.1]|nr:ferric reductase like transmembrane component-domain-containing protein [Coniochaeta sp. 2T2.1]